MSKLENDYNTLKERYHDLKVAYSQLSAEFASFKKFSKRELKKKAEQYAISVSPWKQDRGETYDIPTRDAYIQGFEDALNK